MCFVSAIRSFVSLYMCLEFHTCIVVTQCGFFPLCVANFAFVTTFLLMHYFACFVFCVSYILSVSMCILFHLVPL